MAIVLIVSLLYYNNATFEFGNNGPTKMENDLAQLCSLTLRNCGRLRYKGSDHAGVADAGISSTPRPKKSIPTLSDFFAVH